MQPEFPSHSISNIDLKRMPTDRTVRVAIRDMADLMAQGLNDREAPTREALRELAVELLNSLGYPLDSLGFTMVSLSNAFWLQSFASVPFNRRLLLLPHCLRSSTQCAASYTSEGLICARCGLCNIDNLQTRAEKLGYKVVVAEGVTAVTMRALEGEADAILGVACLDSLEKSHSRMAEWGIPHLAVPLLTDGCVDTETDQEETIRLLQLRSDWAPTQVRSYVPLLRFTNALFERDWIEGDTETDRVAHEWLNTGGKRFRPFVTVAAYAIQEHGLSALEPDANLETLIPDSVRKLAVAVEAMHKASLVHDDIQDGDAMRYGRETLHRTHGVPIAINIGDYLIGLGYRLIASAGIGVEDIIAKMSAAHVDLCRGQGQELLWTRERPEMLAPLDALASYRLKTAPAFETALYVGLRAFGPVVAPDLIQKYASYIGEAYQVDNDLDDWDDIDNKGSTGLDARAMRPTILLAFALEAGAGSALKKAHCELKGGALIGEIASIYKSSGAFEKAERLYQKLRSRALDTAQEHESESIRLLLSFLARTILPERRLG
jgi:geranylgeranyl pyrophosphate synthase